MGDQWQARREGLPSEPEAFWNEYYRRRDQPWSGNPNAFMVAAVAERRSGTALEIGCGDGGDAIWLAGRGWRVTGVDISEVALRRAAERAADAGVGGRATFERHDLADTFPDGRFDLVGSYYTQTPLDFPRTRVLQRAAGAVAPGGLLLLVEHGSAAPWSWNPEQRFPSVVETLASLELDLGRGRSSGWPHRCARRPARMVRPPSSETMSSPPAA